MLYLQPESANRWRLSFIGSVYADEKFFASVENIHKSASAKDLTLVVDIKRLDAMSDSCKEVLPHLFRRIKSCGFSRANLDAKRSQNNDFVRVFESVLDREFGSDGTISLE